MATSYTKPCSPGVLTFGARSGPGASGVGKLKSMFFRSVEVQVRCSKTVVGAQRARDIDRYVCGLGQTLAAGSRICSWGVR